MINSIETYKEAGYKAGQASKRRDQGMVSFQQKWLTRALALETKEDAQIARDAYNEAYRQGSGFYN